MSWDSGEQLPDSLLRSLAEHIGRGLSYTEAAQRLSAVGRLARQTTQAWYADFESLLFYFIGQGFACSWSTYRSSISSGHPAAPRRTA